VAMRRRPDANASSPLSSRLSVLSLAALLVTAGLAVGGCGEKTPTTASEGPIDACTLLTVADVEKVLEVKVGDPQRRNQGEGNFWMSMCNYQGEAGNETRSASILLKPHQDTQGAEKAYAAYEAELVAELGKGVALAPIEGIGQRAGWQDFGTSIGQLAVFQGPYQLIITASATPKADQLTNAKALARKALENLQAR
jgi:hypothetical protein